MNMTMICEDINKLDTLMSHIEEQKGLLGPKKQKQAED